MWNSETIDEKVKKLTDDLVRDLNLTLFDLPRYRNIIKSHLKKAIETGIELEEEDK